MKTKFNSARQLAITFVVSVIIASTAAAAVHFNPRRPTFIDQGTTLEVIGRLVGLGNGDVTIQVTATGTPSVTCSNPNGNPSPGQNPSDVTVSGDQTINAADVKNGSVSFDVTTAEPSALGGTEGGCPNDKWTATITDVDFTSVTIKVRMESSC